MRFSANSKCPIITASNEGALIFVLTPSSTHVHSGLEGTGVNYMSTILDASLSTQLLLTVLTSGCSKQTDYYPTQLVYIQPLVCINALFLFQTGPQVGVVHWIISTFQIISWISMTVIIYTANLPLSHDRFSGIPPTPQLLNPTYSYPSGDMGSSLGSGYILSSERSPWTVHQIFVLFAQSDYM